METLKQWRTRLGWSREEAAKRIGYTYQGVYYKERGRTPVTRLDSLAAAAAEAGYAPVLVTRDTMAAAALEHGLDPALEITEREGAGERRYAGTIPARLT